MLGAGQEILDTYVAAGQVKIIFWPMTPTGGNSYLAAIAAYCAGQQDALAYWTYHDFLYDHYKELTRADLDYFVDTAVSLNLDEPAFTTCFYSDEAQETITRLDAERMQRGIQHRPTFDVAGNMLFGSQPFAAFDQIIQAALP